MDCGRRQWIIGIGAAVALLTTACSVFRSRSEIDEVSDELESRLRRMGGPGTDERLAIAEDIRRQAHSLLDTHDTFADEFNRLAIDRTVPAEDLYRLVNDYGMERTAARKVLLQTQDRLHAAVPADQWPQILELLNRKANTVASGRGMAG